jgi:hypothetical protein
MSRIAMKKIVQNKRILHTLLGFLIASSAYLYLEYKYEQKTLQAFINSVYHTKDLNRYDDKAVMLAAMQKTHLQMQQKEITSMDLNLSKVEELFTSPLMTFALTKDGACGGNSLVLAQILDGMGYQVRPLQMLVNGTYGGHIVLEANLNNKWIVFDPLYNLYFTNEKGELASVEEIQSNWNYYRTQTPANYNMDYKFDGVRYTNWSRMPILGSLAKATLNLFMGKTAADRFSLRTYMLNPKKFLFFLSIYLLGFSFISILNNRYLKIHLPNFKFKRSTSRKMVPQAH